MDYYVKTFKWIHIIYAWLGLGTAKGSYEKGLQPVESKRKSSERL